MHDIHCHAYLFLFITHIYIFGEKTFTTPKG